MDIRILIPHLIHHDSQSLLPAAKHQRHFSQKIKDDPSTFLFLRSSYRCSLRRRYAVHTWRSYPHRTSVRVFLSQFYDTSVELSNECPACRFRAGPCSTFFSKVARRAPPYTALIKTRRRNFPRERVSLMRRSRNTNASRLSFIKKETREPRDQRVAHLA